MKRSLIAALSMSLLAGCGDIGQQADKCMTSSNPDECHQWVGAGGNVQDYLIGGLAGFALAKVMSGGRQQTVIVQDTHYHGPSRHLRSAILSQDRQIARLQDKVRRQGYELQRQQAANAQKKDQISAMRNRSPWSSPPQRSWGGSRSGSWGSKSTSGFGRRR